MTVRERDALSAGAAPSLVSRGMAVIMLIGLLAGCSGSNSVLTAGTSTTERAVETVVETSIPPTSTTELPVTTTAPPATTTTEAPLVMPELRVSRITSDPPIGGEPVEFDRAELLGGPFEDVNAAIEVAMNVSSKDSGSCRLLGYTETLLPALVTERVVSLRWEVEETFGDCSRPYGTGGAFTWDLQRHVPVALDELFADRAWRGAVAALVFDQLGTDESFRASLAENDFERFFDVCHGALSVDGLEFICDGNTVGFTQGSLEATVFWFDLPTELSPLGDEFADAAIALVLAD